jgi:hypothetical protein
MTCRLAGVPVPQRAPPPNKRAADEDAKDGRKSEAINGATSGIKKPRVNFDGSQTAAPLPKPSLAVKRPAEAQLTPEGKGTDIGNPMASNFKRARVEDDVEGDKSTSSQPTASTSNKRTAFVDAAALRESADGRTKRAKLDKKKKNPHATLDGAVETTAQSVPSATGVEKLVTCISCLDEHKQRDVLQLKCQAKEGEERHAYCRECLNRLFESSITDPSNFPPRCCKKIISAFECIPFLTPPLFARFVAKRDEQGTPNRTYCSSTKCSKWIRPANIQAKVATCQDCGQKTCHECKAKQHDGLCPVDKDVQELMKVARRKHWQLCPGCKEMVELERGCYHITVSGPVAHPKKD